MNRFQSIGTAVIFAVVLATGFIKPQSVTVAQDQARAIDGCTVFNKAGEELAATIVTRRHSLDPHPQTGCLYRSRT